MQVMIKKLTFGLAVIAALALATGSSCERTPTLKAAKNVKIYDACKVSDDQVTIKPDGQVSWTATKEANSIVFPNTNPPNPPPYSPFTQMTAGQSYPIAKGQTLTSGPVRDDVKATCSQDNPPPGSCQFKYNVTGATVGCPKDPVVVIQK
jgi:hypothetical protein